MTIGWNLEVDNGTECEVSKCKQEARAPRELSTAESVDNLRSRSLARPPRRRPLRNATAAVRRAGLRQVGVGRGGQTLHARRRRGQRPLRLRRQQVYYMHEEDTMMREREERRRRD